MGAGRPPKGKQRKSAHICVRVESDELERIREVAVKLNMSLSDFVLKSTLQKMKEIESQSQNNAA